MGRFDAPYPGSERTKNSQWYKAAPRDMRSPDHLWGEYWQRFNLFPIPIFGKEDYFRTAMAIAKDAKSKQDFERKFEQVNEQRLKELQSLLTGIFWDTRRNPPARTPSKPPDSFCNFSCLEHFVRLLGGYVLDRKAEAEEAEEAAEAKAAEEAKAVMEKQKHMEENSLQEWGGISVEDETETLIREIPRSPSAEPDYEEHHFQDLRNEEGSQLPFDIDWAYRSSHGDKSFFARGFEPCTSRNSDDDDSRHFEEVHETYYEPLKLASDDNTDNFDDDDSQDFVDANETVATEDGLGRRSSVLSKNSSSNSTKKRVRFSDEDGDEDEDVGIHEPKRQKLENPPSPTPTSPTAHVPSSIKQVADASVSRKRTRSDKDEEEEEEEYNGFKRQKTENAPRPPSLISPASSTEDASASHLAQVTLEKVPKERASSNGRRKQRIQKSTSQTPLAKSLKTRSSRRATSSTLWELDSSGKSRLV